MRLRAIRWSVGLINASLTLAVVAVLGVAPAATGAVRDRSAAGHSALATGLRSAANGLTWDTFRVKPQVSRSCLVLYARCS